MSAMALTLIMLVYVGSMSGHMSNSKASEVGEHMIGKTQIGALIMFMQIGHISICRILDNNYCI